METSSGDGCLSITVFLFPFGIWIWFHFELRALENETKVVVTVTVGGEENPRVLGNLCLPHHSCTTKICLGRREEEARPTVQARKLKLRRAQSQKRGDRSLTAKTWSLPKLTNKGEVGRTVLIPPQAGLGCKCIPLISVVSTVLPEDRPGLEITRNLAGVEGRERRWEGSLQHSKHG